MEKSNHTTHYDAGNWKIASYIAGFIYSLALTSVAYLLVVNQVFSHRGLMAAIAGLAITQLLVQLMFFLHMGRESKPRWNLKVMLLAVVVVGILVGGSLWIMYNLNYQTHSTSEVNKYLQSQDGL